MTGHLRTLVLISALMGLFMAVGYLIGGATMGQLLCIPMLIVGAWLILRTR